MSIICSKQLKVPSFGKRVSDYAVGESVFLMENGSPAEYLIVNQGIPSNSSLYDSSCDGTWLLRRYVEERHNFHSSKNYYDSSSMHSYLNGDYLNKFDLTTQSAIKTVKIPYYASGTQYSGANGVSTKIFLLGGYEIGWNTNTSTTKYIPVDGACLSYFEGTSADEDDKRIATLETGGTQIWWTRSAHTGDSEYAWNVSVTGDNGAEAVTEPFSVRPALILPYTAYFDPFTNVFVK